MFEWKSSTSTPTKFNIASEDVWLEDYFPFGKTYFQGLCFSFLDYGNIQSEERTFVCRPKRRGSYTYHRVEPHHHFSAVAGQKGSPNDDIEDEAYDMRQRQPHGCQLIMTTQVTTKIRYCKGLKVDLLVEDAWLRTLWTILVTLVNWRPRACGASAYKRLLY